METKKVFSHLSSISLLKVEKTNKQRNKDQSEKSIKVKHKKKAKSVIWEIL